MTSILIADSRLSDAASIMTSADVAASMPLSYLQKPQPTDRTRFTNLAQTISFDVDLTAAMVETGVTQWNFVALLYHNIDDVAATWQIEADSSQAGLATPDYDSAALQAWPSPGLKPDWRRIHSRLYIPTPRTETWLRITVNNAANADGFLEFGRLYIADAYVPVDCNANWGDQPDWLEEEQEVQAEGGPRYPRATGAEGIFPFTIEPSGPQAAAEIYNKIQRIRRVRGSSQDVFVDLDPSETQYAMDKMVYGTLVSSRNFSYNAYQSYAVQMTVKELR